VFDSIIIRNQSSYGAPPSIDLGFLAEALIFYQQVNIIVQSNTLPELIRGVGTDALIELLTENFITIKYLEKRPAIHTREEVHTPLMIFSPDHTLEVVAPKVFQEVTGKSGRGRRLAKSFQTLVEPIKFEDSMAVELKNYFLSSDINAVLVENILNELTPEYSTPQNFNFDITEQDTGVNIETNLNFNEINNFYRKKIPASHSTITKAFMLGEITYHKEEIKLAAQYSSEIASTEFYSKLHQIEFENLLNKVSSTKIEKFQDHIFEDSRSIQDAINKGTKTFDDLIPVLQRGRKFKEWLKDKPLDADLLETYFKEVRASTWIDKLPGKSSRWMIATGLGIGIDTLIPGGIGTATGIAVSAADNFLLEKIVKGWKPNQFVEGSLKKFIGN